MEKWREKEREGGGTKNEKTKNMSSSNSRTKDIKSL
jgi:hypothetical protein